MMQTWVSNIPLGRVGEPKEIVGPGMGPTELPRVEEGKAPDSSLSVAWMAKPGPVASKTQVWLHDVESTCAQLVPAVGRRLQA